MPYCLCGREIPPRRRRCDDCKRLQKSLTVSKRMHTKAYKQRNREAQRRYMERHPDRKLKKTREQNREAMRRYRAKPENREHLNAYKRAHYLENRDKIRAQQRLARMRRKFEELMNLKDSS